MRIWLINHYAVPPQYYPLARQNYFAKNLMRLGHEVTIFAASTVHNSNKNLIEDDTPYREDVVDGVHYVLIRCKGYHGNGASRILNMLEFARKLPGVCDKYPRPDAIVATSMPPMSCAAGIKLARKYGCRGIAEIADLWPESIIAYGIAGPHNPAVLWLRRLEKWIYTKADAVVFTMEGAYDYIKEQHWEKEVPQSKVFYINNGVDLELFDYNKEHFRVEDKDLDDPEIFKVVYTGSIRRVNGLGLLLDVAKAVQDPRVRFLIWGDGDERPMLEQRVKDENIGNVVFKGRVEKKFVPSIVSRADVNIAHCISTPVERYGISFNKMFEYFAAGKIVLSDFPTEYNPAVQCGAGITVNVVSPANIAAAVDKLASLPEEERRRFEENSRAAAHKYDFKKLTSELLEVIQSIPKKE